MSSLPDLRKNIMLGTAGHVDHGKTALIKLLTGCNTDRLAEEQRRGLTIDLGFAPCRLWDERIVGVVDVPGHVDFIRNMVAGAHGIDVVIFVIAANDGVMPQTREHLDILTLMGVRHGLVALTKIDLVDAAWLTMIQRQVQQFVSGTFLQGAPICPISNITGEGFDGFFQALNVAVDACAPRDSAGIFRMWVSESFAVRGFGTVATGVPCSGTVRVGEKLLLQPGDMAGRVRRLEVYGEEAESGRAGECVACNLLDIPRELLLRGSALCGSDALQPVSMVEADLRLLDFVAAPLKDYSEVHLHVGTAQTMAHVAVLDDAAVYPARTHLVQLRLATSLALAPGDRFILRTALGGSERDGLTTIGGGRLLGASNTRLRRRRPWVLETLAARSAALDDPAQWCAQLLREADGVISVPALARLALQTPEQAAVHLATLRATGIARDAGAQGVVHADTVRAAADRITADLSAFHDANPQALGLDETELLRRAECARPVYDLAREDLLAAGVIARQATVLSLSGHSVSLSPAEDAMRARIASAYCEAGLTPPDPASLPAALRLDARQLARLSELLIEQGELVRLAPELIMHRDAVALARRVVITLFVRQQRFTTMEFRDALGVSRKYAVPLLDYFDQQRLTARNGNLRTPGKKGEG